MALSLERVQKTSRKKEAPTAQRKPSSRRPWQTAKQVPSIYEDLAGVPELDLAFSDDFNFLPADLDMASSKELIKTLLRHHVSHQLQSLRKRSYLIARLTHAESWWARLKIYPQLRLPLPSWMTQVQKK